MTGLGYPRKGPGTRGWEGTWDQKLGYPPERTWDQRLGGDLGPEAEVPPYVNRPCENITSRRPTYADVRFCK